MLKIFIPLFGSGLARLGVLREAKSRGIIKNIKGYMDLLRTVAGFWLSEDVYEDVLKLENE
ncbi:MAG: DUF3368 domain-containing protein [Candidatus Scalindua sp.]